MIGQIRSVHEWILSVSRRLGWLAPLLARVSVGLVFVSAGAVSLDAILARTLTGAAPR